ncbi:hypothetical protein [Bradyrhizobium sp. STM 3562]|uniref:hypothetical protein n=1 Tax=Bradyrhizobium sp. STM 3562 TaxID=578924 RepID=UPI00388EB06C
MLMHLPIVILTALPVSPVADNVPKFDIARECSLEGGTGANQDHCKDDENQALQQVHKQWSQFTAGDRQRCLSETTMDGTGSYVEYLTCLEMARDARNAQGESGNSQTVGKSRK